MDIYERLGATKLINAQGTVTKIGGSLMDPDVLGVMREAAGSFVNITEFHHKAGERVADILGVPGACITCGAAAGIAVSAAACMAGGDGKRILQLPDTHGMRNECLMMKSHRTPYDQALLLSGMRRVEAGTDSSCSPAMLEAGVTGQTAMFFYVGESEGVDGSLPLEHVAHLMHGKDIPVVVDAAAELPPLANIRRYLDKGADLVIFSGGKEIRGPQSSGVILGEKSLIDSCAKNCCPNHGIGRGMKIDKESIAGFTRAVEILVSTDYEEVMRMRHRMVDRIIRELREVEDYRIEKGFPSEPGIQPRVIPRVYIRSRSRSALEIQESLLGGVPAIQAGIENGALAVNPQCLSEDEVPLVVKRLKELGGSGG